MSDLISREELKKKIAHLGIFDVLSRVTFETETAFEEIRAAIYKIVDNAPAINAMRMHYGWEKGEKHE